MEHMNMTRLVGIATSKPKSKAPRGFTVWEGLSALDNQPIAVIATLETNNRKTGDMVQVWILRSDVNPVEATKTGQDFSICGTCPHRHHNKGACYVNVGQAPNSIYKAFKNGRYPEYDHKQHAQYLKHRKVRLGAYGDPSAAPYEVMRYLAHIGIGWTGYTHQAKHHNFDERFFDICMISADSPKQAKRYQDLGARTFRVAMVGDAMHDSEIECLSDSKGMTCLDCGLCNGNKREAESIVIAVHGSKASNFKTSTLIPLTEV